MQNKNIHPKQYFIIVHFLVTTNYKKQMQRVSEQEPQMNSQTFSPHELKITGPQIENLLG